jgi:hypothetical protein
VLDILICSLKDRQKKLDRLMAVLQPQVNSAAISVHIEQDTGELCVGGKRNRLLSQCVEPYCAFVDDDDMVDAMYVPLILDAIDRGREKYDRSIDCVGICGYIVEKGQRTWQFRHSVTVENWCKDKANRIYFRPPNHLNPIRTDIAQQGTFPAISFGEDKEWSEQIKGLCRTEIFIETPIYFYMRD